MKIFVLNGPSAGGKTTALEVITQKRADVEKLVTVTTRKPRPGEVDGVDYNFLTVEEFHEAEKKGDIVEKTVYAGVIYGILDSEIQRIRNAGKDCLVILDIHGVSEMKRFYGAENVVSVFVYRDLGAIYEELKKRPISEKEIERRFEQAKGEMKNCSVADYVVYNIYTQEKMVEQVEYIIDQERNSAQKAS